MSIQRGCAGGKAGGCWWAKPEGVMESVLLTERWARMGVGHQECTGSGNLCMCVCTFMCACVCAYPCVHVCVSMSTVHVRVHIHVCMCVGMSTVHVCVHTHMCMCVHTHMCMCVCVCLLCKCVYAYPCVPVYVWRRSGQRKRVGKPAKSLWFCQLKQDSNAIIII